MEETMTRWPRTVHAIAALAVTSALICGLSACTASPPAPTLTSGTESRDQPGDEGQSTADACALIQEDVQAAAEEFEGLSTADPAAVFEAMRSAADKLSDTATQITNDEVAALVPPLQDMFTRVSDVMEAISGGDATRIGELAELGPEFERTSRAFQELCAP
jgi:hypothetical protein